VDPAEIARFIAEQHTPWRYVLHKRYTADGIAGLLQLLAETQDELENAKNTLSLATGGCL